MEYISYICIYQTTKGYEFIPKLTLVMVQPINLKHTSDLVSEFRHQLLKRREHCYDVLDSLDELNYTTIDIVNEEIDRINKIFKLIQNNKL